MLPVAHQGSSDESELFNSMKAYLNNRSRLQPFIGLSSIIECVNGGAQQREAFYICEVCMCRLDMADMRNHIMGSLHRHNYIKTKHPEMVLGLGQSSDLSKLAWPLMDIAKKIEEKEGPGNVQVVEFDKTSYQQMEGQSDNAKAVIDFLKDTLKESDPEISDTITSKMWEKSPSKRIVLYSPQKSPVQTTVDLQISPQQSCVPESLVDSKSFLNDYAGQMPLIGLERVIECKSEDDQTYCFLCHCCRVRSLKNDIIDHLTSASHTTNYLMETHPEKLESVDLNDVSQMELLAEKLNNEEIHTTKIQVVRKTESLCIQMTGKSYHWCVKTLGCNKTDYSVKYVDVKTQKPSMFPLKKEGSLEAEEQIPKEKTIIQRTKKRRNPVFKVTLPLTQGSLLVERTSFSKDCLPSLASSTENVCPSPLPDSSFPLDPQKVTWDISSNFSNTTSANTNVQKSNDFFEHKNVNMTQDKDGQWFSSFVDQSFDNNTNIVSKAALPVDKFSATNAYNAQAPPLFRSECMTPQGPLWPVGSKDNEASAPNPYYQLHQTQYVAPDYIPQQLPFSSGYVQGGCMIPQVPQAGNSFSHNNSISLTNCSQSFTRFYSDQRAYEQQYVTYQGSTSGWRAHQPQPVSEQVPCYGPCCVYPRGAFPNFDEPGSSSSVFYPWSNFFNNQSYHC